VIQLNIVRSIRLIIDTISDVHRNAVLSEEESDGDEEIQLSDQLLAIKERLKPLRHIENILVTKLLPTNEAEGTKLGTRPDIISSSQSRKDQEVFVRPGKGWHGALLRGARPSRPTSAGSTGMETPDDTQCVLGSCRSDMIALWQNPTVRTILRRRKVRLEELPGLYVILFNLRHHVLTSC
jgi:guanine nucleotide-binding protein alpha-1 subunit